MKISLCSIGKMENNYIKEYVQYYIDKGVDKIFLYDNNDVDGEHFEDIIQEYIDDGYVEIINYRGFKICQLKAYQDCYDKHNKEYDWMMFFDCDEFIAHKDYKTTKDFLSDEKFKNYDMIHINWLIFDDNGMIGDETDEMSVLKRFTKPRLPINFTKSIKYPENFHIKSIIRGGLEKVEWKATPHTPSNKIKCCNADGKECSSTSPFCPYGDFTAYLKHFSTKTIKEWLENKMVRGFPDQNAERAKLNTSLSLFFKINKKTKEKEEFIEKWNEDRKKGVPIIKIYTDTKMDDKLDIFINTIQDIDCPNNKIYKLLCLGDTKLNNKYDNDVLYDNTNDNISSYNKIICEFSGLYWVWKNYEMKDYVGFCQYRKRFRFGENVPDIDEIFKKHDAMIAFPIKVTNIIRQYNKCHNIFDLIKIKEIIIKNFPQYSKAMADTFLSDKLYPCNIFIMKKDDFKECCDFIWSVIKIYLEQEKITSYEDCVKRVENNKEDYLKNYKTYEQNGTVEYQARFVAYLIERLTNIFIRYKFKNPYLCGVDETIMKYKTKVFK